jgi:hypothetical protein
MSRTAKDDKKRGPLAFGKGTKNRAYGYEYWTSRGGKPHGEEPGKFTKKKTHKRERKLGKVLDSD